MLCHSLNWSSVLHSFLHWHHFRIHISFRFLKLIIFKNLLLFLLVFCCSYTSFIHSLSLFTGFLLQSHREEHIWKCMCYAHWKRKAQHSSVSSIQFSRWVMSNSLRPHEWQHARPPCPSPTPGVHWDSRLSSRWCRPAISSSVVPFSSCPQSLPASSLFQWVNSLHEVAKVLEFQL